MKKWISMLLSIMLLVSGISVFPASALAMVDKTGKNPRYYGNGDSCSSGTTTKITLTGATGGNRYIVFTSAHVGQYKGSTNAKQLTLNL